MFYVTDLWHNVLYTRIQFFISIPKKNVIFNILNLLFQNQYFFLVNSSNLMDTIKTIIVLLELLF